MLKARYCRGVESEYVLRDICLDNNNIGARGVHTSQRR